jgi:hypothetical protein
MTESIFLECGRSMLAVSRAAYRLAPAAWRALIEAHDGKVPAEWNL